jgi:hypothetical protein
MYQILCKPQNAVEIEQVISKGRKLENLLLLWRQIIQTWLQSGVQLFTQYCARLRIKK